MGETIPPFHLSDKELSAEILKRWGMDTIGPVFSHWDYMLEAAMRLNRSNGIGKMMKEYHEGPEDDLPEAEIITYDRLSQAIAAKAAPAPPDDGDGWLSKLPVGTTFLTTKNSLRMEPELIKVTLLNKTKGGSAYLMLDIPGNPTINMYVNMYIYSKRNVHMDTL